MLTETEIPLKFYGHTMQVIASLRDQLEREIARIGANVEWRPSICGIETYRDSGGPTAAVSVWTLIVEDDGAINELQKWIDKRQVHHTV